MKINIAVFGSGSGSNAENLYNHFASSDKISVVLFCSNKPSFILKRANKLNISSLLVSKEELTVFTGLEKKLSLFKIDFIVLAGFLLKIPEKMIQHYFGRIVNIHPSLIPKYSGKGMYGDLVHKSVILNNEYESGITIHLVNKNYDEGRVLLQKTCAIEQGETVSSLRKKVQELEHYWYPKAIEDFILS